MNVYNPQTHDLVRIAGDPEGDWGNCAYSFRGNRHEVQVRYRDLILTMDVYLAGSEVSVHMICPRCLNYSWIKSADKAVHWDGEKLSVERFACSWELGRGTDGTQGDRIAFGLGLCRLALAIDNNVAREV